MRWISKATRVAALSTGVALWASPVLAGTHPPTRNGFMIGFGVGGASLGVDGGDHREGSVTINFRIGGALRQDLVLHFESSGWDKTFDTVSGEVNWTFSTNTAALTYFPGNRGLFVRGGIGLGVASVELKTGGVKISDDDSGLGLLAAAGYEWRLSRKFAMAPQIEYTHLDLDQPGSTDTVGGSLGFNWYW